MESRSTPSPLFTVSNHHTRRCGTPCLVDGGAAADVFISADTQWLEYLEARRRIQAETRRDIAGTEQTAP